MKFSVVTMQLVYELQGKCFCPLVSSTVLQFFFFYHACLLSSILTISITYPDHQYTFYWRVHTWSLFGHFFFSKLGLCNVLFWEEESPSFNSFSVSPSSPTGLLMYIDKNSPVDSNKPNSPLQNIICSAKIQLKI